MASSACITTTARSASPTTIGSTSGSTRDEAVAFNKDQCIAIIGQRVTPEIRQTALFLGSKGIRVTCIEFTFFQADGGRRLLSQEIVVGKEHAAPRRVVSGTLPVVSEAEFLESCDKHGKAVFSRILDRARHKSLSIHWGTKGFSVGVDVDGTRVVVCYIYPPASVFKQTFRTALRDVGGVERKTATPVEVIESLRKQADVTGLFRSAGRELKCHVNRAFTATEIDALVAWCESVEHAVVKHGPTDR